MPATIGIKESRTTEVEIVSIGIAGINSEVPDPVKDIERTVEICCIEEVLPLPIVENVAQIEVALFPINAIKVSFGGNSHEVIEVYLIASLVLLVG